MIVRGLINDLLLEHATRFQRGLATGDSLGELYKQFNRIGSTHVVAFDEIDI